MVSAVLRVPVIPTIATLPLTTCMHPLHHHEQSSHQKYRTKYKSLQAVKSLVQKEQSIRSCNKYINYWGEPE